MFRRGRDSANDDDYQVVEHHNRHQGGAGSTPSVEHLEQREQFTFGGGAGATAQLTQTWSTPTSTLPFEQTTALVRKPTPPSPTTATRAFTPICTFATNIMHLEQAPPPDAPTTPAAMTTAAVLAATQPPPPAMAQSPFQPRLATSAFREYLTSQWGVLAMNKQSTTTPLQWQNIDGDTTKVKAFREQALRISSFTPFLAMTKGSHLISIIYGITIYTPPTAITALKDQAIGFYGNRTVVRDPIAILLQQQMV
jgi:hypothetical protein